MQQSRPTQAGNTTALADLELLPLAPGRCNNVAVLVVLLRLGTKPLSPLANGCGRYAPVIVNDQENFSVFAQAPHRVGGDVLPDLQFPVRIARDRIEDVSDHAAF